MHIGIGKCARRRASHTGQQQSMMRPRQIVTVAGGFNETCLESAFLNTVGVQALDSLPL